MIAAPISAYLVKILPINILAICVGGLIIFTNSNALLSYFVKEMQQFQIQLDLLFLRQSLFYSLFRWFETSCYCLSYKKSRVNKYN